MTGSTNRLRELAIPRSGMRSGVGEASAAAAADSPLARLRAFLLGRRPEARRPPPLKNVHYIAVHMAAAANNRHTLR